MICVFHTQGAKHGLDQLDTKLWMNGDPGFSMNKLQGIVTSLLIYFFLVLTYKKKIDIRMFLSVRKNFVQNSTEIRQSFFLSHNLKSFTN